MLLKRRQLRIKPGSVGKNQDRACRYLFNLNASNLKLGHQRTNAALIAAKHGPDFASGQAANRINKQSNRNICEIAAIEANQRTAKRVSFPHLR